MMHFVITIKTTKSDIVEVYVGGTSQLEKWGNVGKSVNYLSKKINWRNGVL